MSYRQLVEGQRYQIQTYLSQSLSQRKIAAEYDQALFALRRECGGNNEVIANKIANFPTAKRKNVLRRLEHDDFKRLRQVKLSRSMLADLSNNMSENSPLNWWQWLLLFIVICVFIFMVAG